MIINNLTHSDLDGCVSAIVMYNFCKQYNKDFRYYKCTYKTIDDTFKTLFNEKDVFFLTDISLIDEHIITDLAFKKNVVIIDHHEKDKDSIIYNQYIRYDEGAGCQLTYNYLKKKFKFDVSEPIKKLIKFASDYDTWEHKYFISKHLNRLYFYHGFDTFFKRFKDGITEFDKEEKDVLKIKDKYIKDLLNKIEITKFNYEGAWVIAEDEIDEVADYVKDKFNVSYVAIWNPKVSAISLRSSKSANLDLSEFARIYGGGGHFNAAAFLVDSSMKQDRIPDILKHLSERIDETNIPF